MGLGRLSDLATDSNFTDLMTSECGVGGWQHRSALSQSRALFSPKKRWRSTFEDYLAEDSSPNRKGFR